MESSQAGGGAPAEDAARRLATERRHTEEIAQLKELLESTRLAKREVTEQMAMTKAEAVEAAQSLLSLRKTVEFLDAEKAELEHNMQDQRTKLDHERALVAELRRSLDQKSAELESTRKNFNRDRPLHGDRISTPSPSPSSKYDMQTAREEIKGLK